jgi:hypothetical protein
MILDIPFDSMAGVRFHFLETISPRRFMKKVSGMPVTPKLTATCCPLSTKEGQAAPDALEYDLAAARESW